MQGKITFHDDSDAIDVSPTGMITASKDGESEIAHVIIIARHESGNRIDQEFNFQIR